MTNRELKELLRGLAERTNERVAGDLAPRIKKQIPPKLPWHRGRMDTINIIIDLRVNKLAAAAVIVLALVLCARLLESDNAGSLLADGKLVAQYLFGGANSHKSGLVVGQARYRSLAAQGRDVVFYGEVIDPEDKDAILVRWKLADGSYRVMFADLRQETVTAERLISLQSRMLLKKIN